MTSKEALERLHDKLLRYDDNYDYNDVEIIKQDLERLKKFAHENASLHTEIESLQSENEIWKKAIENSNKAYDVLMQNSNIQFLNQNQEIFKLKKVIDILTTKDIYIGVLKRSNNSSEYNNYMSTFFDYNFWNMSQEDFDLLKEYL